MGPLERPRKTCRPVLDRLTGVVRPETTLTSPGLLSPSLPNPTNIQVTRSTRWGLLDSSPDTQRGPPGLSWLSGATCTFYRRDVTRSMDLNRNRCGGKRRTEGGSGDTLT